MKILNEKRAKYSKIKIIKQFNELLELPLGK